ncbi:MAG: DUF192 domain-containing protein [Flavobacteriales bacterium Tduv]
MKRIIFCILLGSFLSSCKKEETNISDTLEIEFIKEGELQLKNGEETIKKIHIELATTDQERSQGLMHRSSMQEDQGMLFIFDEARPQSFWMKNTRIPLDIIYINSDSAVLNISKNIFPMAETGITQSNGAAKFVLEVNGGMSDKWGIKEGVTKISWRNN